MPDFVPVVALLAFAAFALYVVTLAVSELARTVLARRTHENERKMLEVKDTCSFYFVPHDGQQLTAFLPGQYLTLRLPLPGLDKPVTHCYSLSDTRTHPDYYRATVKRLAGEVKGLVSTYFHRELSPDVLVDVKAPGGHFHIDAENHGPVVLIGGDEGFTPALMERMQSQAAESPEVEPMQTDTIEITPIRSVTAETLAQQAAPSEPVTDITETGDEKPSLRMNSVIRGKRYYWTMGIGPSSLEAMEFEYLKRAHRFAIVSFFSRASAAAVRSFETMAVTKPPLAPHI